MPIPTRDLDKTLRAIEEARDEIVALTADLIRVPTVNPPGEHYRDCAELVGEKLDEFGFETEYLTAHQSADHSEAYPRVNVVGTREGRRGRSARPRVHLNGHFDVVPVGHGWTVDPFGGVVRDGKIYGRGSADMKSGIAAALFAAEAIRRVGIDLRGTVELSATVDEESGGFAGLAHLAEIGRISRRRTDHVIIPEPLDVDRICLGHRGVYWFKITCRGHIAHGCMPFLGVNAIENMAPVLEAIRTQLAPRFEAFSSTMPVEPPAARRASININAIAGGQAGESPQTPCVADHCEAIFDRRFLVEEGFEATRKEIVDLLDRLTAEDPARRYQLDDLMVVHPTLTAEDDPLVRSLSSSIDTVLGRPATLIASPGTYDHKHVARIAGIDSCVAYGPGRLTQAHQPDEWCEIDDLVTATQVIATTLLDLLA